MEAALRRLRLAGAIGIVRPVVIRATASRPDTAGTRKRVHFVRHGQAFHNFVSDLHRAFGVPVDGYSSDLKVNPYRLPEVLDSPLTDVGRQQAIALQACARQLSPTLVVSSPLQRTLQTAVLRGSVSRHLRPAFRHLCQGSTTRWVATELLREEKHGHNVCDQRHPRSEIEADFPFFDLSAVPTEEDVLFSSTKVETPVECSDRAYAFLLWLWDQPEEEVVVCTHWGLLFQLFNTVVTDCPPFLREVFSPGKMRSVWLSFEDTAGR
eukprot:EG_transcript_21522